MSLAKVETPVRRFVREAALAGVAYPLFDDAFQAFGPSILPLTPRHHLLLLTYRNPHFCGGPRSLRAALQYLWLCSPAFRDLERSESAAWRRALAFRVFRLRWSLPLARVPRSRLFGSIKLHADSLFLDRPKRVIDRDTHRMQKQSDVSEIERDGPHELLYLEASCRHYLRYTREEFWRTPYVTTNGLLTIAIGSRPANPDAPRFNKERDRANGDRLRERQRRAREEQAKARA